MFLEKKIAKVINEYGEKDLVADSSFIIKIGNKIINEWKIEKLADIKDYLYLVDKTQYMDSKIFSSEYDKLLVHNLEIVYWLLRELCLEKFRLIAKLNGTEKVQILYVLFSVLPFLSNNICTPLSRMRDIDSRYLMTRICQKINFHEKNLATDYYSLLLYISYLEGYNVTDAPFIHFLKQNSEIVYKGITEVDKINDFFQSEVKNSKLIKRLYFGLPISEEEKQSLIDELYTFETVKLILSK